MSMLRGMLLGLMALGGLDWTAAVQAGGHGSWAIGVSVGGPGYYRPYYPVYPYPYAVYRPYYPVYVAPPTVVVQPAPVIQPVPVATPVYSAPAPTPAYSAPASTPVETPPALAPAGQSIPAANQQADITYHLRMLTNADERARAESVLHLGKVKATQAVDQLAATLAGDRSPTVREAAARSLGLLGSSQALPALQRAAQVDSDRDVRRSAQFAMEVIQSRN